MMKHVPITIFAVFAIVGIATLMLSVSYFPGTAPFAVQYHYGTPYGRDAPAPGSTFIVKLDVGETISNEVEAVSGDLIAGLRPGSIHGRDLQTDYTQHLRFGEPGLFTGGRIAFGRDESNVVTDFLEFPDKVFKYQVEFSPGLRSEVQGNKLVDLDDEDIELLGDRYAIVDATVSGNRIKLRLFGGFGSIQFEDSDFTDNVFMRGVEVNGKSIDAEVKIRAIRSGDKVTIYSIQYVLNANSAIGGTLQVPPLHCVREYLKYPLGMLSPAFDICYKGLEGTAVPSSIPGISGNEIRVRPRGNDEYRMDAPNLYGRTYSIPLAQNPGMYGNRGRDFIFVEAGAPGAPNIGVGDYFLVSSSNDVRGVSHVMRYDRRSGNTVYFEDLASGDQKPASFDAGTGEGQLLMSEGTYRFVVGAGDAIAMDQTNNNAIAGNEANFVLPGGSRIDFGPGFTVRVITPRRLFDDPPAADEVTSFNVLFGGDIDLNVPTPQGTVFKLESSSGGIKQGLTKYGILFTWDKESDSDKLDIIIPGSYAGPRRGGAIGEVYITLDRTSIMRQSPAPTAPPVCGDGIIVDPEYCDPPGSWCVGTGAFERGTCSNDCKQCTTVPRAVCGNNLLENGEQCESGADCGAGFACDSCKCVARPVQPVCGNNLIEPGEDCEKNVDCAQGNVCSGCYCVPAPVEQVPVAPPRPTFMDALRGFWNWLVGLF